MSREPIIKTEVVVGNARREVQVIDVKENFICGFIGQNGWFMWNTDKYDLPAVKIRGRRGRYNDRDRELAARFILPVIGELQEGKNTPLHGSGDGGSSDSNSYSSANGYVSGVAKWMLEEYKDWNPCYSRDTGEFLYYRRTKFKESYLDKIADWKEHCSHCIYRADCTEPCDKPEEYSSKKILSGQK